MLYIHTVTRPTFTPGAQFSPLRACALDASKMTHVVGDP